MKIINMIIFSTVNFIVGCICLAMVGMPFDEYTSNSNLVLNVQIVQMLVLTLSVLLGLIIPFQEEKKAILLLVITCAIQIILAIISFFIAGNIASKYINLQIETANKFLNSFKGQETNEHFFINEDYEIFYSYTIDDNYEVQIIADQNVDGLIEEIRYSVRSEHHSYDKNKYKRPSVDVIQNGITNLYQHLPKDKKLYAAPYLYEYEPKISNEAIDFYNSGKIDSISNTTNPKIGEKKYTIYESIENKKENYFVYHNTIELD